MSRSFGLMPFGKKTDLVVILMTFYETKKMSLFWLSNRDNVTKTVWDKMLSHIKTHMRAVVLKKPRIVISGRQMAMQIFCVYSSVYKAHHGTVTGLG